MLHKVLFTQSCEKKFAGPEIWRDDQYRKPYWWVQRAWASQRARECLAKSKFWWGKLLNDKIEARVGRDHTNFRKVTERVIRKERFSKFNSKDIAWRNLEQENKKEM